MTFNNSDQLCPSLIKMSYKVTVTRPDKNYEAP